MAIAADILLASEDMFKKWTPVMGQVDFEIIKPFITTAQDNRIEHYLGTDLMTKIKTDAAAATIAGNYITLLDTYMRKPIVWWTLYEALPTIRVRINGAAVGVNTPDDMQPATDEEFATLRSQVRSTAESYSKRLVDYLAYNANLFPEYNTNTGPDKHPSGEKMTNVPFGFSENRGRNGSNNREYNRYRDFLNNVPNE